MILYRGAARRLAMDTRLPGREACCALEFRSLQPIAHEICKGDIFHVTLKSPFPAFHLYPLWRTWNCCIGYEYRERAHIRQGHEDAQVYLVSYVEHLCPATFGVLLTMPRNKDDSDGTRALMNTAAVLGVCIVPHLLTLSHSARRGVPSQLCGIHFCFDHSIIQYCFQSFWSQYKKKTGPLLYHL